MPKGAGKLCVCGVRVGARSHTCKHCGNPFLDTISKSPRVWSPQPQAIAYNPPAIVQPVEITQIAPPPIITGASLRPEDIHDSPGIIPMEVGNHFDDLYGKHAGLSLVMANIAAYNESNGKVRNHTLLVGDPSGGKTTVCNRLRDVFGKENVLDANGESLSSAGMQARILFYPGNLPPVLMIQELDKVNGGIEWMLSMLDDTRKLIKISGQGKEGQYHPRDVPFICIATINDLDRLESMSKPVANRFSTKIQIRGINEQQRYDILKAELFKAFPDGNEAWIQPAIDYCKETNDLTIRSIKSVMLGGRDRLLDGSYQNTLRETRVG